MVDKNIIAVEDDVLSDVYDRRYVIINKETGEILDDAQGYGYKSPQKAYAAYNYKTRDRSKDKERAVKRKKIEAWMKTNKNFVDAMDDISLEVAKGSLGDEEFNAKLVNKMLKDYGLKPDFTASELLRVWRNKH